MFDLGLNFIQSISSSSKCRVEFKAPVDVKLDTAGNVYVAEFSNNRVQVMDKCGVVMARKESEDWGLGPSALHIVDKYVYVSDHIKKFSVLSGLWIFYFHNTMLNLIVD